MLYYNQSVYIRLAHRLYTDFQYFLHTPILCGVSKNYKNYPGVQTLSARIFFNNMHIVQPTEGRPWPSCGMKPGIIDGMKMASEMDAAPRIFSMAEVVV